MAINPYSVIISADNGKVRTGAFFDARDIYEVINRYLKDGYSLEGLEIEVGQV